jgi:hypothetical protein
MYEVITGERLFVHAGLTTSADEIYSQPVPVLSRKVPGLTPELDAIMTKALALSPDARFQTAGEFQEALTRCAHRNGLLMSAPEVARELLDLCGPPDQWRDDEDDDDLGYVPRAATEVYDGGGEDDDDEEIEVPIHRPLPSPRVLSSNQPRVPSRLPSPGGRSSRASSSRISSTRLSRPRSESARLQGVVELTSIINMIDLENAHHEAMGERPLVDLDLQPRLDGPRFRDPGPLGEAEPPPRLQDSRRDDPGDFVPTQPMPRQRMSRALPIQPMHFSPPARQDTPVPPPAARRWPIRTWMVIVAILVAAAVAGMVVAMSGPDVAVQRGK